MGIKILNKMSGYITKTLWVLLLALVGVQVVRFVREDVRVSGAIGA